MGFAGSCLPGSSCWTMLGWSGEWAGGCGGAGGGTVELLQSARSVSALNVFAIQPSTPKEFFPWVSVLSLQEFPQILTAD